MYFVDNKGDKKNHKIGLDSNIEYLKDVQLF